MADVKGFGWYDDLNGKGKKKEEYGNALDDLTSQIPCPKGKKVGSEYYPSSYGSGFKERVLSGKSDAKKQKPRIPCYETHKPFDIGGIEVTGGSCSRLPKGVSPDVIVGLDGSMPAYPHGFPWEPGHAVYYPIDNMKPPVNPVSFGKLIDWLGSQMDAGRSIHIGCIGGHGRTGLVLAALVKARLGIEDAITYVRENYCSKAVESYSQVEWLHKHFGIKKVGYNKSWTLADDYVSDLNPGDDYVVGKSGQKSKSGKTVKKNGKHGPVKVTKYPGINS